MTGITYAATTDVGMATQAYPEVIRAAKIRLLQWLRAEADQQGLDILTEKDLTWAEPVHFRHHCEGFGPDEVWTTIECPPEEARFTRYAVEAIYEEIK
jgi:hypothetical protein